MTTTQTPTGNTQDVTNKQENQRKLGTIPGIFKGNGNVSPLERWASGVGGGLLTLYGITRRDWAGGVLALLGGGFRVSQSDRT